eukprot:2120066-Pyramimonas_sp.AAC.1
MESRFWVFTLTANHKKSWWLLKLKTYGSLKLTKVSLHNVQTLGSNYQLVRSFLVIVFYNYFFITKAVQKSRFGCLPLPPTTTRAARTV